MDAGTYRPAEGGQTRRRLRQSLTTAPVRRLGFMAGQISVPDDFDRMGKEEIEQMFGGGA